MKLSEIMNKHAEQRANPSPEVAPVTAQVVQEDAQKVDTAAELTTLDPPLKSQLKAVSAVEKDFTMQDLVDACQDCKSYGYDLRSYLAGIYGVHVIG